MYSLGWAQNCGATPCCGSAPSRCGIAVHRDALVLFGKAMRSDGIALQGAVMV